MTFRQNCAVTFMTLMYHLKVILFAVIFTAVAIPLQLLPVLLIFFPLQRIMRILAQIFRPDLDSIITGKHALFSLSNYTMNCYAISTLSGNMSLEEYRQTFQERNFTLRKPNGELVYQGFKQYPVSFLGYGFWKTDDHFNLANHMRHYDYDGELTFPKSFGNKDLERILPKWVQVPWKRDQSPWEMLFLLNESGEHCELLVLTRFNHVLCDGYSLFEFFKIATKSEFRMPKIILKPPLTKLQRLGLLFKIPYDTAANILCTWQAGKFPDYLDPSRAKELVLSISPVMSVQDVKTVKNKFQVSYSAVLCALYFGAIDRALQVAGLKGIPNLASTSLVVPDVNHPGGLVIHAGMVYTSWPIKSVSPVERLLKIQDSLRILSQSSAPYAYSVLAEFLSFYPIGLRTVLTKKVLATWKHSLDATHLPVTTSMEIVLGLEIKELFAGNVPWLTQGLTCTSGGLNNKLKFTFASYKGFFGESDVGSQLGIYAHDELRTLLATSTKI